MSAANKAKGTRYENVVAEYLQGQGFNAKRLPRAGKNDIGDVGFTVTPRGSSLPLTFVIEAKDRAKLDWPKFLEEAETEADNYNKRYPLDGYTIPVVVSKRRNHGVHRSYVMVELDTFADLLHMVGITT